MFMKIDMGTEHERDTEMDYGHLKIYVDIRGKFNLISNIMSISAFPSPIWEGPTSAKFDVVH